MKTKILIALFVLISIFGYAQSFLFSGPFTNATYNLSGNVVIEMEILQDNTVQGYINFTEYPYVTTLCGAGNFTGTKNGNSINFTFTSNDPDPGCGSGGSQFELEGTLEGNKVFRGYYYVDSQVGFYETHAIADDCPINIDMLQNHYNTTIGTNDQPYAYQYLCIADKTCNELALSGDDGWAGGFVKYMFDYIEKHNHGNKSIEIDCYENFSNWSCFSYSGFHHLVVELFPAFYSYCIIHPDVNINDWTNEHEAFLLNAVEPCFDDLGNTGLINWLLAESSRIFTLYNVRNLRESAQDLCQVYSVFGNTNDLIFALPSSPTENQLFNPSLLDASTLKISTDTFFLKVGEEYQLSTLLIENNDTTDLTNSSLGTQYFTNVDSSVISISDSGIVNVKRSYLPLVKARGLFYVYAINDNNAGVGQFAIYDEDNDYDALVNSFEEKIGLPPNIYNSLYNDSDLDFVTDIYEALLDIDPYNSDTDNDLFSDIFEFYALSDPKDPSSIPINISSITAISDVENDLTIRELYPNPAFNNILIEISSLGTISFEISIFDIIGNKHQIKTTSIEQLNGITRVQADLSNFEKGIYFINVSDQKGNNTIKKIIKL